MRILTVWRRLIPHTNSILGLACNVEHLQKQANERRGNNGAHLNFWQDCGHPPIFVPSPRASGERVRERGTSSSRLSPPHACGGEGDIHVAQKVSASKNLALFLILALPINNGIFVLWKRPRALFFDILQRDPPSPSLRCGNR